MAYSAALPAATDAPRSVIAPNNIAAAPITPSRRMWAAPPVARTVAISMIAAIAIARASEAEIGLGLGSSGSQYKKCATSKQ